MTSKKYTILGFITILIWGTSPAFTRMLSSGLGAFTAAALVNIIGGIAVLLNQKVSNKGIPKFKDASKRYWILCGGLFVIYTAASYISMAIVDNEQTVVTLVLIRFLWPLFTLVFSIPVLKAKASPWLIVAVLFSLTGIAIAKLGSNIFHLDRLMEGFLDDSLAYVLCFIVSITWALYTNLTKKLLKNKEFDGVGIFMLISGLLLGAIALGIDEPRNLFPEIIAQLLYQAIAVSCIANVFWNKAIIKGNFLVVVLASNFLPILSTVISGMILGVPVNLYIVVGSIFVIVGTFWSKKCFREKAEVDHEIHKI